jgi:hypothetical protein
MIIRFNSEDPRLAGFFLAGIGLFFAFIGLIFCVIAFVMYSNTLNSLQGTIAAQGRIVSCEMRRVTNSDKSVSYQCLPTVRFTTASGEEIDFVSSMSSNTFHEGDEVPVQYHPDHPRNALISSFMGLWFLPLMFGGLGSLFVIIGVSLLLFGLLRYMLYYPR